MPGIGIFFTHVTQTDYQIFFHLLILSCKDTVLLIFAKNCCLNTQKTTVLIFLFFWMDAYLFVFQLNTTINMCGRFSLTVNEAELNLRFETAGGNATYVPRYNGAPTQNMAVITSVIPRKLDVFRWGLVPPWAKDISIGSKMINARAETITEKVSFKKPLQSRRCLIPADGFFEWQQDKNKQPFQIRLKLEKIFSMAGIWETWIAPTGEIVNTFSIITTEANDFMKSIHSRMPVILNRADEHKWLYSGNMQEVISLLKPYHSDDMEMQAIARDLLRAG
jgi:putative SOS response-associated peptidase YedK